MLHLPGAGTKSSSSPKTPVRTAASSSGPRRKRSSNAGITDILLDSVVVGAAQVIITSLAKQLAFAFSQPCGTHRTVEHGFSFVFPRNGQYGFEIFHVVPPLRPVIIPPRRGS